jgi:hypothetical protein
MKTTLTSFSSVGEQDGVNFARLDIGRVRIKVFLGA